jgi:MFS family permease
LLYRGEYFRSYFHDPSPVEIATMVAILEVGAFVSSLLVGRIGDIIGRRKTILYGSIVFFVGGAMQSFATSMAWMMAGRVLAGLGVGMLSTIVPVYSPRSRRRITAGSWRASSLRGISLGMRRVSGWIMRAGLSRAICRGGCRW